MPYFTQERWNNEVYSACAHIVDENNTIVACVYGYDKRGYRLVAAAPEMYRILSDIRGQLSEVDLDPDTEADIREILDRIDGKETAND